MKEKCEMICPFCGEEMTAGYLKSKRKAAFLPGDSDWGLRLPKDAVVLTKDNWVDPSCAAHCCADCKIVIAAYTEE